MKYIIMCGGNYPKFKKKKQLLKVNGEVLAERTIRLLKENGIKDVVISTNCDDFNYLNLPIVKKDNKYLGNGSYENEKSSYCWLNAFYLLDEPCCYLYGDVYFSDEAIKTIIDTEVKDTMFFCVPDKQDVEKKDIRNAKGREPIAFKVKNNKLFNEAVNDLLKMVDDGKFKNKIAPFSWHLYRYLNGLDYILTDWGVMNNIFEAKGDYVIINDYTTDVDDINDIKIIENCLKLGGGNMIKCEVIEKFNLKDFDKLKNIQRKAANTKGMLYVGDVFECDEDTARYLSGKNALNKTVIKVIEVQPKEIENATIEYTREEVKPKATIKKKKTSKKVKD